MNSTLEAELRALQTSLQAYQSEKEQLRQEVHSLRN